MVHFRDTLYTLFVLMHSCPHKNALNLQWWKRRWGTSAMSHIGYISGTGTRRVEELSFILWFSWNLLCAAITNYGNYLNRNFYVRSEVANDIESAPSVWYDDDTYERHDLQEHYCKSPTIQVHTFSHACTSINNASLLVCSPDLRYRRERIGGLLFTFLKWLHRWLHSCL